MFCEIGYAAFLFVLFSISEGFENMFHFLCEVPLPPSVTPEVHHVLSSSFLSRCFLLYPLRYGLLGAERSQLLCASNRPSSCLTQAPFPLPLASAVYLSRLGIAPSN